MSLGDPYCIRISAVRRDTWTIGSIRFGVLSMLGAVGVFTLAQCSLLDLSGLTDPASTANHLDATLVGAFETGSVDAPADEGGDLSALDSGIDGGDDAQNDDVVVDATPDDARNNDGPDAGGVDAASDAAADSTNLDAKVDAGGLDAGGADTGGPDAFSDGGDITTGLVALYLFDELGGTTAADSSGNGHTATMQGATFTAGLRSNAATMSGVGQYVILPQNITSGLTSFSISVWANVAGSQPIWCRIFDFGTGPTTYMFLTPNSYGGTLRFAITTSGNTMEQRLDATPLGTASWQHAAITVAGTVGTLYVAGAQVAQNAAMTLSPASLGVTTQNWLGRSQFSLDPYLTGQIDNFRIYNRALSASEIKQLFLQRL